MEKKSEEEDEEDNENNEGNDNNYEENEEEDDDKDEDDNDNDNDEENKNIPEWYNIKAISKKTIDEIIAFFKVNKHELNTIKYLIKKIIKLSLIYERISRFGFSVNDCNDILNFNFNKHYKFVQIYKKLEENILLKDEKNKKNEEYEKNKFFYDFQSDSWKMIMMLISSDLSNTPIFFQGSPGSGKSCCARYYGKNRAFNNRNPILSINCHRDLKFDYLVGNYNFKDSKFHFVDGPLITAMKNGEPILLDEFNLCPENILLNLIPILKSNINEQIYLKGVPSPIYIKPGFLIIATGNYTKEKGRNIISTIIADEIRIEEISSINFETNLKLLESILKNEYESIFQPKDSYDDFRISADQIKQIVEALRNVIQFKLSLRQIKCLLERITRFSLEKNSYSPELKRIPVIYILISYIIPQLKIGGKSLEELLIQFDKIMKYDKINEIKEFISSEVKIETIPIEYENKSDKINFIKKGKIYLKTKLKQENLPQVVLQVYFWIRMSCNLESDNPSEENLLLAGPTSYKEFILNKWLNLNNNDKEMDIDRIFMTKNTDIENLIGTSSLDDEMKLAKQIENLKDKANLYFFHQKLEKDKLKLLMKNKNNKERPYYNFIYQSIKKLTQLL